MKHLIMVMTSVLILMTATVFAEISAISTIITNEINTSSLLMILLTFILLTAAKWRNVNK